jgi:uncharacterized NAD(P)/FAD-binding protein YdhS
MAVHLLSQTGVQFRVTLIEAKGNQGRKLGRGIAYSTDSPDHLLNTRASNMSAFPADPAHFQRWLALQTAAPVFANQGDDFVRRSTYGAYLGGLLNPWLGSGPEARLHLIPEEALALHDHGAQVAVDLSNGEQLRADYAVLATGHVIARDSGDGILAGAWDNLGPLDLDADVLIIGAGLSMVDNVLSLLASGHRGQITALSRRGLLPRAHAPVNPIAFAHLDIPWGKPVSHLLHWLQCNIAQHQAQGGDWRDVVDGLRPHVAQLWRSLPIHARARFLRHGATWWDVHRHRIPPASQQVIEGALARGQLVVRRGSFLQAEPAPYGAIAATWRQSGAEHSATFARVIDCRGIRRDAGKNAAPLAQHLLHSGQARLDALRIGLDVDAQCQILGSDGQPSLRLLAIGPASRATFWEITAIPDIRLQAERLAQRLAQSWALARAAQFGAE